MSTSQKIKALLSVSGKKQADLMEPLEMSSRQSLSNKFTNERWSAADLIRIASVCDCKLAFILSNGERITLDD